MLSTTHWQYNPYTWLPLAAAAISAAIGWYAYRRRNIPGSKVFVISMCIAALWASTYALQLASADLSSSFFWLSLQMLGPVILPVAWLAMTLQFTGRERWLTRARWIGLGIIPAISLLSLYTDYPPGFMAKEAHMEMLGSIALLHVQPGPWFWVHSVYSYLLVLAVIALLADKAVRMPSQYRRQPLTLLAGISVIMLWHMLYVFGLFGTLPVNPTTLISTLGYMIIAWGIFRYRLFDIMPVAANRVVESMADGLIVLDVQGRVVNLNPAIQRILKLRITEVMGYNAAQVFAPWPSLLEALAVPGGKGALALNADDVEHYYELDVLHLSDKRERALGRLVTLRDVTERRRAEEERERLIAELQDALAEVKTLSGLLPICAWCGKMRDDEGYWQRLDIYLSEHSTLQITHGICPECMEKIKQQISS